MSAGTAAQAQLARALKKLNATHKVVRFRLVTQSDGNTLLGLPGTTTTTDTDIDPQPVVEMLKPEEIETSRGLFMMGDYKLLFAGSVDETLLRTRLLLLGTDVLRIIRYYPAGTLNGVVLAWEVIARVAQANS
jgi:hypothetical protein